MKPVYAALSLLMFATWASVPNVSFARGSSAGHAGGFHGGAAHAGVFHGGRGHVGGFRAAAPIAIAPIRRFNGGHAVRGFPVRRGAGVFVAGVALAAPLYPYYGYSSPYYSYAPGYGAPEAAPAYWYYCPAYRAYYPYVQDCPGGWQAVAPQPPPPPY
ncbi:MAG: hypothetical protein ACXWCY_12810 [Burkholderiales bacterium]